MSESDEKEKNIGGGDPLGNGDIHGTPDATLGGYVNEHSRPPAFEGADGEPYTVSIEVEKTGNLRAPFEGYLVFPRWASSGVGVIGHLETGTLLKGTRREKVEEELSRLSLVHVKLLLDRAIERSSAPVEGAHGEGVEGVEGAVDAGADDVESPDDPEDSGETS